MIWVESIKRPNAPRPRHRSCESRKAPGITRTIVTDTVTAETSMEWNIHDARGKSLKIEVTAPRLKPSKNIGGGQTSESFSGWKVPSTIQ
jgi:hypothetical protein